MVEKLKSLPPHEWAGWIGITLIQLATMPSIIANICGWSSNLPPLSMILLVWSGLALFLWRAIEHKDMLSIVSNSVGFILNSVLLALIVFPW
jgi:hypothetical protein